MQSTVFQGDVNTPYNDVMQQSAAKWIGDVVPVFELPHWTKPIVDEPLLPVARDVGEDLTFLTAMDDSLYHLRYECVLQTHVAVCEASVVLGSVSSYYENGRYALHKCRMRLFLYALKTFLLDGHFKRLDMCEWCSEPLRGLVRAVHARLMQIGARVQRVRDIDTFYSTQVPHMIIAIDNTHASMRPWATYALTSIIMSCPLLHRWDKKEQIPPSILSAYTCLLRRDAERIGPMAEEIHCTPAAPWAARTNVEGFKNPPAVAAFVYIYSNLAYLGIDRDHDCTPLLARQMLWQEPEMGPATRCYMTSNVVVSQSSKYGTHTVTRMLSLVEDARCYFLTHASHYPINPDVRARFDAQLDALVKHLKAPFPLSTAMLLTCSPIPLPGADPHTEVAMPDVSLAGVSRRMAGISVPGFMPTFSARTNNGDMASRWAAVVAGTGSRVAMYDLGDYVREVANLMHCMRLQGAAYAGHTRWCAVGHMVQTARRVLIDSDALRVFMVMKMRVTLLNLATSTSVFLCIGPLVYRELRALPHILSPTIRGELASALCGLIATMILPHHSSLGWPTVSKARANIGFVLPLDDSGRTALTTCEAMLRGPFHVFVGSILPRIITNAECGTPTRALCTGIVSTAMLLLFSDDATMRLPTALWIRILRIFFVMDSYLSQGRDVELPLIVARNPCIVQALAFMYVFATCTQRDVINAHDGSAVEPDLMGAGYTPAELRQCGARRSANRKSYILSRMHLKENCMEKYIVLRDGIRELPEELSQFSASATPMVALHNLRPKDGSAIETFRRAAVRVSAASERCIDIGSAINELECRKQPAQPRRLPRRKRVRQAHEAAAANNEECETESDREDTPPIHIDDLPMPISEESAPSVSSLTSKAISTFSRFALTALLMAAAENPRMYENTVLHIVSSADAYIDSQYRTFSNSTATHERKNRHATVSAAVEAARTERRDKYIPDMYRREWFPPGGSPEACTDDKIIRSLFILELITTVMPQNLFLLNSTVANNLPTAHRFGEQCEYDQAYADEKGQARYAYALTHGVRDGHVAKIVAPPTGPHGAVPAEKVPYRMHTARWASQMKIENTADGSHVAVGSTGVRFNSL